MEKEKRKRKAEDEGGLVGRYLQSETKAAAVPVPVPAPSVTGVKRTAVAPISTSGSLEFGQEKKKKKGGGFGDFSGW